MSTGTTIATHASLPSQVAVRWCRLAVIVLGRSPGRRDRCRRLPRAQTLLPSRPHRIKIQRWSPRRIGLLLVTAAALTVLGKDAVALGRVGR